MYINIKCKEYVWSLLFQTTLFYSKNYNLQLLMNILKFEIGFEKRVLLCFRNYITFIITKIQIRFKFLVIMQSPSSA